MATPFKISYAIIRITLILVLVAVLLQSLQIFKSAVGFEQANALLNALYGVRDGDFLHSLDQLDQLDAKAFPVGSYSGTKAHAKSLAFSRSSGVPSVSEQEVIDSYITALQFNPYDGFLWAKLALHFSMLEGVNQPMLHALDSAMKYARNDYNTFKVLLDIAIRDWPRFDCKYKEKMLAVVNDSLHVDDRLLSRWNGEHGHMKIEGYVTSLMEFYNFDPFWAVNEVNRCRREQQNNKG